MKITATGSRASGARDRKAFERAVRAIGTRARAATSRRDFEHLRRIERRGRWCRALGLATAWIRPNPASAALVSMAQSTRWLILHHVSHKAYDRIDGIPDRYTSAGFAAGGRRFVDWFDWIEPDHWAYEHNHAHHFHLGEDTDPDVLERNSEAFRRLPIPNATKRALVGVFAGVWRIVYYAPATVRIGMNRGADDPSAEGSAWDPRNRMGRRLWSRAMLPVGLHRFVVVPLLFFPLGRRAVRNVAINMAIAEAMSNVHAFLTVVPSHTASDLWRFDSRPRDRAEHLVRQVLGSANYPTGGDTRDHLSLWLNYQIEHHLLPDLTMYQYQQVQPEIRQLCEEHDLAYIQEPMLVRLKRTMRVAVGSERMRRES